MTNDGGNHHWLSGSAGGCGRSSHSVRQVEEGEKEVIQMSGRVLEAYKALVQKFLAMVDIIKRLNPAYRQPGDGSDGTCDCIGLIIGALRRMGLKWTGIHGSNYAARYQTIDLKYIERVSELELGDWVFKACDQKGIVKKACNAGTKKHSWALPDRYLAKGSYYNGDLLDYYHVGVVTKTSPLNITHMTSPRMKVDTDLSGGWNYHGKGKPLVNRAEKDAVTEPTQIPTPEPTPSKGCAAIVVADNGLPVKMREYPSTDCRTWVKVMCGTEVTIVEPGEKWAKINACGRTGWYMMSQFLDVVGDGKGKY